MKSIEYNKNTIILLIIILLLILSFYILDVENIEIQPHLYSIYDNTIKLHNQFPKFLNLSLEIEHMHNIYIIKNMLDPNYFNYLKNQFNNHTFDSKDVYFRKAGGIDFFNLHKNKEYNGFLELYFSTELIELLQNIFKKPIQRPPLHDPNASSIVTYTHSGDFIDWHKDYSPYNGDRYILLLTIINENKDKNGLSQNEFIYKYDEKDYSIKLEENSAIIFKGSEILHKATAIGENERRILFSVTFCDICQEKKNILIYIYEKIKNIILY